MKKFLYVLLGAAGALLVRSILERRSRTALEGVLPRPIPTQFNGEVYSVEDEVSGPLAEV